MSAPGPQGGWPARAVAAYRLRRLDSRASPGVELAAAVRSLTGRAVEPAAIVVDLEGRAASARVDGVTFRWADAGLSVVRPCAHCGLGAFASRPLGSTAELGYALSDWAPLHDDCAPFAADMLS